jgi:hypothetical protein
MLGPCICQSTPTGKAESILVSLGIQNSPRGKVLHDKQEASKQDLNVFYRSVSMLNIILITVLGL